MAYDRDEFVRLLTDYYEFCSRVFWDGTVRRAPPGGWPSVNQETLAGLGKNDTVIDLLRRMPYLGYPEERLDDMPVIMDKTEIVDYRREKTHKYICDGKIEGHVEPFQDQRTPPSCAFIAVSQGRNGYYVVLDTDDGCVYWTDPNGQHDEPDTDITDAALERFAGDPANEWREGGITVYRPADFFALCKQRFRELRWIGIDTCHMESLRMNYAWGALEEHEVYVDKMRRAGWPGDGEGGGWDRAKFEALLWEPR